MSRKWTLGLDADDTLWHNERYFLTTQEAFRDLLDDYSDPDHLDERLLAAEIRNIKFYGYGIKGFTLSMIETALEVSNNRVPGHVIDQIVTMGREMLAHPIDLLPGVADALSQLATDHHLIVITKGDLLDQERKVAQSGLGELFEAVEIVSEKTAQTYQHIFARYDTSRDMMVGNSLKSDVIPAISAGAWGTYVPYETTWDLEKADAPDHHRFHQIKSLADLPDLLSQLA